MGRVDIRPLDVASLQSFEGARTVAQVARDSDVGAKILLVGKTYGTTLWGTQAKVEANIVLQFAANIGAATIETDELLAAVRLARQHDADASPASGVEPQASPRPGCRTVGASHQARHDSSDEPPDGPRGLEANRPTRRSDGTPTIGQLVFDGLSVEKPGAVPGTDAVGIEIERRRTSGPSGRAR